MKKKEINCCRNKMITETKESQILKNYSAPMLNYKQNKGIARKIYDK